MQKCWIIWPFETSSTWLHSAMVQWALRFFVLCYVVKPQKAHTHNNVFAKACCTGIQCLMGSAMYSRVCHDIKKSKPGRGLMVSSCTLVLYNRINRKIWFFLLLPTSFLSWKKSFFTLFFAFWPQWGILQQKKLFLKLN